MPRFVVPGRARTQGSYQPFIYKVDKADPDTWVARVRAVQTDELKAWRRLVGMYARREFSDTGMIPKGRPVRVTCTFYLARPKAHYRTNGQLKDWAPDRPTVVPDGDKLVRAVWDALTGIAYEDDSQVCEWLGEKLYGKPRVVIEVEEIQTEENLLF